MVTWVLQKHYFHFHLSCSYFEAFVPSAVNKSLPKARRSTSRFLFFYLSGPYYNLNSKRDQRFDTRFFAGVDLLLDQCQVLLQLSESQGGFLFCWLVKGSVNYAHHLPNEGVPHEPALLAIVNPPDGHQRQIRLPVRCVGNRCPQ